MAPNNRDIPALRTYCLEIQSNEGWEEEKQA